MAGRQRKSGSDTEDTAQETTEGPGGGEPEGERTDEGEPRGRTRRGAATSGDDHSDERPDSGTSYLNTTSGPLVYDKDGHTVAAGEWTPEVNLDGIGRALRQQNHLLPPSAL